MKETDKSNQGTLSEFIRYTRGEMTKKEENAFQRKLQKDPFAEEALEGFSEISPREAADDIDRLGKRLINRIRRTQRIVFYRIAASVAVLIIISSVFIIIERNKSVLQLSQGIVTPSSPEVTDSNQFTESLPAESRNVTLDSGLIAEQVITNDIRNTAISAGIENPSRVQPAESLAVTEKKDSGLYMAEYMKTVPSASKSEQRSSNLMGWGEILSSGDSVSKRSKAAQGVAPEEIKAENEVSGLTPPSPVDGKESFDKYVEKNIRKPASLTQGESTVVEISFTVTGSGIIENIKVISSPAQEFSDEAVRLIKEGPAWKPAIENGNAIAGEVKLKIVFK